jgi:hypothetical protein
MMKGMMHCTPMISVVAQMMSSPKFLLRIYPRGDVLVFLVVVYLESPSHLGEVKVFDETELLALRTGEQYGRGPPAPMCVNSLKSVLAFSFDPDAWLSA